MMDMFATEKIKTSRRETVKKDRKKQDDRLLKRLSWAERKQQEALRRMILNDRMFQAS